MFTYPSHLPSGSLETLYLTVGGGTSKSLKVRLVSIRAKMITYGHREYWGMVGEIPKCPVITSAHRVHTLWISTRLNVSLVPDSLSIIAPVQLHPSITSSGVGGEKPHHVTGLDCDLTPSWRGLAHKPTTAQVDVPEGILADQAVTACVEYRIGRTPHLEGYVILAILSPSWLYKCPP